MRWLARYWALRGCCGLLVAGSVGAQSWIPVGPPGGDVRALAADPSDSRILYLGTQSGALYRSDDVGLSWRRLDPGLPLRGVSLDEILVDPQGGVFVGFWEVAGSGGGVARSSDGGRSFRLLPGIAGESVRGLAIAPTDPRVLVAGTLTGILRTDDCGESWRRISPDGHPHLRNVGSVALDPRDPAVMYAGTWHLPWKTLDGGASWRPIPAGMIPDSDVMTLTVDSRDPARVYATACSGIYRSRDAGERWTRISGIPSSSRRTRAFARDPDRPDTLFAGTTQGLWISDDGGGTWRLGTERSLVVNALLALPGGVVLAGTDAAGVLRSADRGRSWSWANQGFSERFVSRIAHDPGSGRLVVAVLGDRHHSGVLSAPRPEGPWSRWSEGLEGREVVSLRAAGSGGWVGTDDGVYHSPRPTVPWRRLSMGVAGLDLHPRVDDLVVLDGMVLAATPDGLLRSPEGGGTWTRRTLGLAASVSALAAAPGSGSVVLAATPLGIYRSPDAGESWEAVSGVPGQYPLDSIEFFPGSATVLFATTTQGLLLSEDAGRSWLRREEGLPRIPIAGLAIHPDGRRLFVSDFRSGRLFHSTDAGRTWQAFTTDGLGSKRVWALAVDPTDPGRLLASAASGGLHVLALPTLRAEAPSPPSAPPARNQR